MNKKRDERGEALDNLLSSNSDHTPKKRKTVAEKRQYLVTTVAQAKQITSDWLTDIDLLKAVAMGLPEVDDRHHVWRVPLVTKEGSRLGEVVIDAYTTEIDSSKSTRQSVLESRLLGRSDKQSKKRMREAIDYPLSSLRNTIGFGDCSPLLDDMPTESVDLIFTSPPYFNARPEYSEYDEYEEYLFFMRQVIRKASRVLNEGRFFVMNTSPVLLRRASRNESSRRIAVPFDLHRIFVEEGFDFIDDLIWMKPEGAGWATGRGRRFAADRHPLQYKAVPVTEYVLVYRKRSDRLIDWHIRNHPDRGVVEASRIDDGYEKTNVWKINPKTNSKHPAPFPLELASKVVQYYSFKGDVILDPFGGSGTVGRAAASLERRFVLFDNNAEYIELMKEASRSWVKNPATDILWINCQPPDALNQLHLHIED